MIIEKPKFKAMKDSEVVTPPEEPNEQQPQPQPPEEEKPQDPSPPVDPNLEPYEVNALVESFKAIKEIIKGIKENPNDPNSPPLFKTIKMNNGQLHRIVSKRANTEAELVFPAVLIHFINVRYLIQQSRIGEGRATTRIQFILNTLNNSDEDVEMQGYEVFQRINTAIQTQKDKFPALTERFQLTYFDQPLSMDNGLQPFWIDYEIWFKDYSAYRYRDYEERYVVVPPFTNHSDQKPECNQDKHEDHKTPTYDDVSGLNNKDL